MTGKNGSGKKRRSFLLFPIWHILRRLKIEYAPVFAVINEGETKAL